MTVYADGALLYDSERDAPAVKFFIPNNFQKFSVQCYPQTQSMNIVLNVPESWDGTWKCKHVSVSQTNLMTNILRYVCLNRKNSMEKPLELIL